MDEIVLLLKTTRENSGVSLKEASEDLKINELILENIEKGSIGCFKDIFELKDYMKEYAKYLGLNPEKIIDEFNEYLFDYTSKIPTKEIEKKVRQKEKMEKKEKRIASPYTVDTRKFNKEYLLYIVFSVCLLVVILAIFFIIKYCFFN